ncbi:MAG TPA: sulfur oxidation c-type cytochrome SoxX [Usitatibacter sp.]|nr:sulfur oxidation c-type cytochrome SoxX [Usitatibacter sp.]
MRGALLAAIACAAVLPAAAQPPSGAELFARPDKGHCLACHQVPAGAGPSNRSDLGPRLEGARMRALGREALRRILFDPTAANPDTVMPPYGRHRILDSAEIDRIVEYLYALP